MGSSASGLSVYLPHVDSLSLRADATSVGLVKRLASLDGFGRHTLVDDPAEADIVLFTEFHFLPDWRARAIRYHPVRVAFPEKAYGYDERDFPWPALPGIFVSAPRDGFNHSYQVPWSYAAPSEVALELRSIRSVEPDLLFSFVGSRTAPVRDALFRMAPHERGVVERVDDFLFWDRGSPDFAVKRARFVDLVRRSKFVLCPRGHGTSSFRIYEAMAAGRVPVILSDQWLSPVGPDWGRWSVRWPERMASELPAFLESIERRYERMAVGATAAFEEWFRPDVAFHRTIEALRPLVESRAAARFPYPGVRRARYVRCAMRMMKARVVGVRG